MSRLTDQMDQSAAWLADQRDPVAGGWGEERAATHLSALNTAEAVIALIDADADAVDGDAVNDGLRFLRARQVPPTASDAGAWTREAVHDGKAIANPDVVRTGLAIEAFLCARVRVDDPAIVNGLQWLSGRQNDDGGWGVARGGRSRILQTCSALAAFMAVFEASGKDDPGRRAARADLVGQLERGLQFLTGSAQRTPGYFASSNIADLLAAPHTILAVLVLQRARTLALIKDAAAEKRAIDWLLASQDDARRLVVEEVELDPNNRYPFLYVTDSLLIRVLSQSVRKQDRESTLFKAALYSVKDRIEPEHGACYGYRVFTWSTARSISAMSAASTAVSDFPDRPAEYHGRRTGPLLTAVMILILAAAVLLGFTGRFSAEVAGFFALIVLAILLVNQRIGEKTFAQALQPILGSGKSKSE